MSDPTYTLAAVHHAGYCYYPDDDRRRSAVRELSLRRELDDRLRRGIQAERERPPVSVPRLAELVADRLERGRVTSEWPLPDVLPTAEEIEALIREVWP